MNLILANQIKTYNKFGVGYQPKNNSKSFSSIGRAIRPLNIIWWNVNIMEKMVILVFLEVTIRLTSNILVLISSL